MVDLYPYKITITRNKEIINHETFISPTEYEAEFWAEPPHSNGLFTLYSRDQTCFEFLLQHPNKGKLCGGG